MTADNWFSKRGMLKCETPPGKVYYGGDEERERENRKDYRKTENGRLIEKRKSAKYLRTEKGRLAHARKWHRRHRNLGYIEHNRRFKGSVGHHVDRKHVIHIPVEMHEKHRHNHKKPETMIVINRLAYQFLEERQEKSLEADRRASRM